MRTIVPMPETNHTEPSPTAIVPAFDRGARPSNVSETASRRDRSARRSPRVLRRPRRIPRLLRVLSASSRGRSIVRRAAVVGLMRVTDSSSRLPTQTAPAPAATADGRTPTATEPLNLVRRGVDDRDGVRLDVRRAAPASPWPRAKTGIATAAATNADERCARVHPASSALELDVEGLQLPEVARQTCDLELRELLGPVEVFEAPLAESPDRDARRQLVLDELSRRPREQHLSSVSGGCNTSGLVNSEPDVAILADSRLTCVQTHPHLTSIPSGQACAARSRCASTAAATASLPR